MFKVLFQLVANIQIMNEIVYIPFFRLSLQNPVCILHYKTS